MNSRPAHPLAGADSREVAALLATSPDFLTVAEVASLLRVSKMTIYRMIHAGELRTIQVGRSFRIPSAAVRDCYKLSPASWATSASPEEMLRSRGWPGDE